jgi:hypothetical protein
MVPGEPGPPLPVESIATARASFSGHDVVSSTESLDRFLFPFAGHNVDWVHSAKDGCGAATRLAFIRNASAPVPYVAFFTILGEKGCLPMALLFAPVRVANRWTYRTAPTLEIETAARPSPYTNVPFRRTGVFRIARLEPVRLPAAPQSPRAAWFMQVAYGTVGNAPAIYALDGIASNVRAGALIEIGEHHRARVALKV